jgi:Domain of unknown function (DUF1883)
MRRIWYIIWGGWILSVASVGCRGAARRPVGQGSMSFLHPDSWLDRGDVAVVDLDSQANVMLMDDQDFAAYRRGDAFHNYGGLAQSSPVRLAAPHSGHWNVVVDLGGYAGRVRAGVRFLKNRGYSPRPRSLIPRPTRRSETILDRSVPADAGRFTSFKEEDLSR